MKKLPKELTKELLGLVLDEEIIEFVGGYPQIDCKTKDGWLHKATHIDTLIKEIRKWILSFNYELKISYTKDLVSIDLCKDGVSLFKAYAYKDELEAFIVVAEWVAKEKRLLK